MKPKDPDTFIDIGVSITRLLLIASGQGMAASLIGEGAGLVKNLRSLLGSGGQRAVSAEKIAADVADQLFREHEGISEADWQVAATNVAPLIDRLSEKDRLAAGYDWKALRPVLRDLGSEERRCTLAGEPARRAFDWVLEVACQHIADLFTEKEALASLLGKVDEVCARLQRIERLLDRPGVQKTSVVIIDHIEVLRVLAPDTLVDREQELADLEAFVRNSNDVWYAMEADMVSGKTAVMASFALNPPDDVHMVSFFIRRTGGDENDRGTFAFVMGAQLAKILGHEYTEPVRDPAQCTEFRQLLRRAAAACRSETTPRPLVLLIDGIDEDSYFENPDGADAKSILSLLPRRLPEGVKIITASRPNPRLPEDVLCDANRRIVSLKPSPIAEKSINRKDMKIFFKSDVAVDIGAFLAACGGVLTVEDLRRLLTMRGHQRILTWDVREYVDRSPGRILTPIDVGFGGQEVLAYRLGHDVVTRAVIRELDPDSFGEGDEPEDERWWAPIREKALAPYCAIIRDWVKECANKGWGESTPSYVLSEACFDLMLNDKKDDGSSVRVVLNRGRYNEMRRRSEQRSYVLRMIDRECFAMLDMNCGELTEGVATSILEVAESRKLLAQASTYITGLPKLYVSYFNIAPEAALDMIMAVDEPKGRLDALRETMKAAIESGRGYTFLMLFLDAIGSLTSYRNIRSGILCLLVDVLVFIDGTTNDSEVSDNVDVDLENWLNEVLVSIKIEDTLPQSLCSFESVDGSGGDAHTIAPFLLIAEEVAEGIDDPETCAWVLADVAGVLARAGDAEWARRVAENAMNTAEQIEDPEECARILVEAVGMLVRVGDVEGARRVAEDMVSAAGGIEEPGVRARILVEVAGVLARAGLTDETLVVAEQIKEFWLRARVLVEAAGVLVRAGDAERARRVAEKAMNTAEQIEYSGLRAWILADVAGVLVRAGDAERARRVAEKAMNTAEQIEDPGMRARALAEAADALVRAGDAERARRVAENAMNTAEQIKQPWARARARALAEAADALAWAGLTDETLVVAEQIKYPGMHVRALAEAADALDRADLTDKTLSMAEQIKRFWSRVRVLVEVVSALVRAGDVEGARRVAEDMVGVAGGIEEPGLRVRVLVEVVSALVRAGDAERARRVAENAMNTAEQIEDPGMRARALAEAADALARAGAIDESREIVTTINEPGSRSRAQSAVIKALVGKGSSNEAVNMLHTAIAEVEGFVRRQDAADCCATLAAACVDAADLLADSADAEPAEHERWLGLARSALARSWLYGASVWNRFDVLLRVAPDLATRLVEERLLADPEPSPGAEFRSGSEPRPSSGPDPEGSGGGTPSSR